MAQSDQVFMKAVSFDSGVSFHLMNIYEIAIAIGKATARKNKESLTTGKALIQDVFSTYSD